MTIPRDADRHRRTGNPDGGALGGARRARTMVQLGRAGRRRSGRCRLLLCTPESDYISGQVLIVGGGSACRRGEGGTHLCRSLAGQNFRHRFIQNALSLLAELATLGLRSAGDWPIPPTRRGNTWRCAGAWAGVACVASALAEAQPARSSTPSQIMRRHSACWAQRFGAGTHRSGTGRRRAVTRRGALRRRPDPRGGPRWPRTTCPWRSGAAPAAQSRPARRPPRFRMMAELAARVGRVADRRAPLRRALELAPGFDAARANLATSPVSPASRRDALALSRRAGQGR